METETIKKNLIKKTKNILIEEYFTILDENSKLKQEISSLQKSYDKLNIEFDDYCKTNNNYKEEFELKCDEECMNFMNYKYSIRRCKTISIICFILMIVSILVHIF